MVSGMSNQARRTAPGLIEIVQKASQSLPPAGGKSNAIRFLRRRVRRKKHFSVCKCGICSPIGEQIMRAADCKPFVQKGRRPFWTSKSLLLGDVHAEILHGQPGQGTVGVHLGQSVVDGRQQGGAPLRTGMATRSGSSEKATIWMLASGWVR